MKFQKGSGDFFALDIGTNAVRVLQLSGGAAGGWSLQAYGYAPVDRRVTASDSPEAKRRLGEVIMTAIGQSGIKTKNIAIGLPSSKTFTTVVDVPMVSDAELKATMKYQIDQYVPMSIDDAKVDWALLGPSLHAQNQQEVLITSVAKDYSEERLEFIESLGLNVIAAEPDPIAMIRALVNPQMASSAALLIDIGELSTDIAITYGEAPRLIRTIPTGLNSLVKAAVQNLSVQEDQARQFILKFGLAPDRLEGQVLRAIDNSLDNFASEVNKSVKFFQTRYPSVAVGNILMTGYGEVIPRLGEYITGKVGIPASSADPWQGIRMSQTDQQHLSGIASEFATVIGLAKRSNRS
ncbi:MAG: type IV pilus assembly protein PilM [Candidatus Saccharimonas sp.]